MAVDPRPQQQTEHFQTQIVQPVNVQQHINLVIGPNFIDTKGRQHRPRKQQHPQSTIVRSPKDAGKQRQHFQRERKHLPQTQVVNSPRNQHPMVTPQATLHTKKRSVKDNFRKQQDKHSDVVTVFSG